MNEAQLVSFMRQLVTEIPWRQNLLILNKLSDPAARLQKYRLTPEGERALKESGGQNQELMR